MRRYIVLFVLLGNLPVRGVPVILPGQPTAAETAFANTLSNALTTTNVAALIELSHCEGDEPWAVQWFYAGLMKHPCDQIRIERADDTNVVQYARQLSGGRSDLPVRWLILLRQPPLPYEAAGTNLTVLPAAWFDGNIVITRRMATFSPSQKRLLLSVATVAILLAAWYAARFMWACGRDERPIRYSPAGLAILLLCFAGECFVVVNAMPWFAPHPLRLLVLPVTGMLACFVAVFYDEWAKASATAGRGLSPNSPGAALVNTWKLWRAQQGPFASPQVRAIILVVVALAAMWLGTYIWRGTSIMLHAQHVQGTVTRCEPHGDVHYTYAADGRQYTGAGAGSSDRIYPVGSPVDVTYSSAHPAYSTIDDDPFLFLKQLTFGVVLMAGFILLASCRRTGRK